MRVRVTDDAAADLKNIKAYIESANATAAARVIGRIGIVITRLGALPRLGHVGLVRGTYEIGVPQLPFVIVYRIDVAGGDDLIVLRVYHAAQDRSDD